MYKCKYFELHELVPPSIYFGMREKAWLLFDDRILRTIDDIRQYWGSPITINNWKWGGKFKSRGYRIKPWWDVRKKNSASQHYDGRAIDFHVKDMPSQKIRTWILKNYHTLDCLEHVMIIAVKSLFGFLGDVSNMEIDWAFLAIFSSIAGAGIFIGSYLSNFITGSKLKPIFGWFVLAMGFYIIAKELFL